MMQLEKNLYWRTCLDQPTDVLRRSVRQLDAWVNENITEAQDALDDRFHIGDVYNGYNLFAYPLDGFSALYRDIRCCFEKISGLSDMWIKAWANVYQGRSYTWHSHKTHTWLDQDHCAVHPSWHGIYCVTADETCTTYKHRDGATVHIPWLENQLVFVESQDEWLHRTWPGERITVAFNIMHRRDIDPFRYKNHWMPLT